MPHLPNTATCTYTPAHKLLVCTELIEFLLGPCWDSRQVALIGHQDTRDLGAIWQEHFLVNI